MDCPDYFDARLAFGSDIGQTRGEKASKAFAGPAPFARLLRPLSNKGLRAKPSLCIRRRNFSASLDDNLKELAGGNGVALESGRRG
jgi:hypothetical protein